MRTLADLLLVAFVLVACGQDEEEGFPVRKTASGFYVDARPKRVDPVEIDVAVEAQWYTFGQEHGLTSPPLKLRACPIEVIDAIAYVVAGVWATGHTDGKSFVCVALWSYTETPQPDPPFTQRINGKDWYPIPPYVPATAHEWGHVMYGGSYGHKATIQKDGLYIIPF